MVLKRYFFVIFFIVQNVIATSNIHTEGTVRYEETPTSQKAVLRDPALLRCVAATRIERCRWTWRPLSATALMRPLVVREFDAFGVGGRDCSVRFRSLLLDHEGEWTCSILPPGQTVFHAAPSALVRVVPSADNVQFSERPQSIEVLSGEAAVLRCVVQLGAEVESCRWTWRPLNQINSPRIPIKEFPPFGNENRDCSVRFRSAQLEQAGEWSCGVRPHGQLNFQPTEPVMLTVLRREMKFVQLSQDLQVAAGETVLLRCVTASRVQRCRWMWRQLAPASTQSVPPAIQVQNFAAFGNESRDCSVRFTSVLPEQAGEWTCGVQPVGEVYFHDAPPARLNLLPAMKIRFVEVAKETRVVNGSCITLPCTVTANVSLCQWTWKSLEKTSEVSINPIEFLPQGNWSRNCSLTINIVQRTHQGFWTCSVTGPPADTIYSTVPAKLTVYLPVEMKFSELTRTIQMPVGSPVLLRCVAAQRVNRCRWLWRQLPNVNNDDQLSDLVTSPPLDSIREFDAFGTDNRDCSIRFQSVVPEQSGEWTCGVQPIGETIFQDAPPAQLTVIPQVSKNVNGSIGQIKSPTIAVTRTKGLSDIAQVFYLLRAAETRIPLSEITANGSIWSLTCRVQEFFSSCFWISPNNITIEAIIRTDKHQFWQPQAANKRFWAVADPSKGLCSLVIYASDIAEISASNFATGHWQCLLNINSGINERQIGSSIFLSISHDNGFFISAAILVLMTFIIFIVMVSLLLPFRFYCRQLQYFENDKIKKDSTDFCNAAYNATKSKKIRFTLPATEIPCQSSHLYAEVHKLKCKKTPVTDLYVLNESCYENVTF